MNIRKYYIYKFFIEFIPIYPMYPLLFESKGLTIAQISMLLAIWSIPALLFEVPSGVLADRWSRKKLLIIGCLLKGICFLCWFFAEGFFLFAVGFFLWGIGSTLRSGSEEALLFDSLKENGKESGFDKVLGRGRFFNGLSLALACLTGGFLSDLCGMRVVLALSILSTLVAAGLAFTFCEVNFYRKRLEKEKNQAEKTEKPRGTLLEGFVFFRKRHNLILVLLTVMVVGFSDILDEYDSLIAEEFGLSLGFIGVWVCARGLLLAAGGLAAPYLKKLSQKILHLKKELSAAFVLCFLGAGCLFLSGGIHRLFSMIFYGLFYFIFSACAVLAEDCLQQRIEEEGRSTVHSILSLLLNLYAMLSFGVLGFVFTKGNMFFGLMIVSVYLVLLVLLLAVMDRGKNVKKKK